MLIGYFRFVALEAVILNKAMSLVVVASALPVSRPLCSDGGRREPMADNFEPARRQPTWGMTRSKLGDAASLGDVVSDHRRAPGGDCCRPAART